MHIRSRWDDVRASRGSLLKRDEVELNELWDLWSEQRWKKQKVQASPHVVGRINTSFACTTAHPVIRIP
ncbi:hypothetical protein CBOM_04656 [Ceraceosorus bombacis]|uniref:Uncharacterized protein n=1 Tax=Ceraceosorus bombacis TaxID=401625 RepID=A0A0P1BN71_9BASI|nr:hypothetical protein CBOM_04656 [Ceraceosorus bombacis]